MELSPETLATIRRRQIENSGTGKVSSQTAPRRQSAKEPGKTAAPKAPRTPKAPPQSAGRIVNDILPKRDKLPRGFSESEKGRQEVVVAALRLLGYTVLETGHIMAEARCGKCSRSGRGGSVKCPGCGGKCYSPGYGNDAGIADLQVSHASRWPKAPGAPRPWCAIEMKTPTGKPREDQQILLDNGQTVICINAWQAVEVLLAFERDVLKIEPNPRLADWLSLNFKANGWN